MRPARPLAAGLLAVLVLGAAGCGGDSSSGTPGACLQGAGAYLTALERAPGAVELEGTPISDCLSENQEGGALATAGGAMVEAATRLNAEARAQPGGPAALRLGYLVGAAARGAEETAGIHADLIRRLESAAGFSPQGRELAPGVEAAYRRGYRAGSARG